MTITRFKLPVTQEHIKAGVCRATDRCAVALALVEMFSPDFKAAKASPSVCPDDININILRGVGRIIELMPVDAEAFRQFIESFDQGDPVPPTTFILEGHNLPEWMLARIKEREALC